MSYGYDYVNSVYGCVTDLFLCSRQRYSQQIGPGGGLLGAAPEQQGSTSSVGKKCSLIQPSHTADCWPRSSLWLPKSLAQTLPTETSYSKACLNQNVLKILVVAKIKSFCSLNSLPSPYSLKKEAKTKNWSW